MIKLFACDCDGTLLNSNSELDKESIQAIRRFQSLGGVFMLATGRNRWECNVVTDYVDNCVLNCDNGSAIFDHKGRQILIHKIGNDKIRRIDDLSAHYDFPVLYHGLKATYVPYDFNDFKARALVCINERYFTEMAEEIFDWIYNSKYYRYGVDIDEIYDDDIIKIEAIFIDDDDYDLIGNECIDRFRDMRVIIGNYMNNIEINSIEADKGKAIKEYCKRLGITNEEVIVVGDSGNDISMFELFPNSYCVKNGQSNALRAARNIIEGNDELGVAKLLNKICDDNIID